ncbi:sensor histidine kinase [Lederbergia graminis]|uniref:Sensor histidine kinase n=1 Tax=Lederbergia graminis TaxID=735518 RepID=A0ABW0LMP1_9BACI
MLKLPNIQWRKSIFFRLVITYLLVNIPIVLQGFYLYNWSYNNASENISRATYTELSYYLDDFNSGVDWMERQKYQLLKDNELTKLAVSWNIITSVERRKSMSYVLHRIYSIKNSSKYIKDIKVYVPPISKTFSTTNSVYDLDEAEFRSAYLNLNISNQQIISMKDKLYLMDVRYSGGKKGGVLFVVQFELDTEYIKETLRQLSLYPGSGSILYSKKGVFALSSNQDIYNSVQFDLPEILEKNPAMSMMKINGENFRIYQDYSHNLNVNIMTLVPEKTLEKPLSFFSVWAWSFVLSSLIAILLVYFSTYRIIHKPLVQLIQGFKRMGAGELNSPIKHDKKDEFGYLYSSYNNMIKRLRTLIDQDYKQKMMMQKSELKQLQSQINPHFLYNSFFILNSLAKIGDVERIEQFTIMLGEYFRFITRNGNDLVSLSEEVKHSRVYTSIQELRFSRRIKVEFEELPKEMENIKVPRLIIQPIIENAYEHSLENKVEDGLLRVTFEHHEQAICIIIEDNNDDLKDEQLKEIQRRINNPAETAEVTGMINIHRRLQLTFGEQSGLILERSELQGLKVIIYIELRD